MVDQSSLAVPLAAQLRPKSIEEFVGQNHLMKPGAPVWQMVHTKVLHSIVCWGPPGTGKTSLAGCLAQVMAIPMVSLSAVSARIQDIREACSPNQSVLLFIDEIHRLNKAQQDVLLPHVESGELILIGATTENPSFALIRALLSRVDVLVFEPLHAEDLTQLLHRAVMVLGEQAVYAKPQVPETTIHWLAQMAKGDARKALMWLEHGWRLAIKQDLSVLDLPVLKACLPKQSVLFDDKGDEFYEQISALHKSIRGSDPDATVYWLMRMLEGGCDLHYVARRLTRAATEDIGTADLNALAVALHAWQAYERIGSPEGDLALLQAAVYLACAPKSNAIYRAHKLAQQDMAKHGHHKVPLHLRNAPTALLKKMGYGQAYQYPHDVPDGYIPDIHYFPENMPKRTYYQPSDRGLEHRIRERLHQLAALSKKRAK